MEIGPDSLFTHVISIRSKLKSRKKLENWKVRIKNKVFWIALIPAVLILIQTGCRVFGVELDFGDLQDNLIALVNAVFAVLVILGIVADPTTEGLGDSKRAMTYDEPWHDEAAD